MNRSACPQLHELELLAAGAAEPAAAAELSRHLALCAPCAEVMAQVRENLRVAAEVRLALSGSGTPSAAGSSPLGLVGREVDGYTIERVLGSGASSTVYQARQKGTDRLVALKVLSTLASGEEHVRRFEHEARVLARLHHPAIAQVFGCGSVTDDAGTRPYIAMELVDGATITQHASRGGVGGTPLSIDARLGLLAQACEAVEYAHSCTVIHRDIKPGNILVTRSGQVRVVDFGFARVTGPLSMMSTMHTAQGRIVGTVAYMSPEHVAGANSVDARSDVYSLGVVGYELLTGRPALAMNDLPLEAALHAISRSEPVRPSRIDPALGGDIEVVLLRAIEKRPQDRYPSAGEFAADIRRLLAHEPIGARRPSQLSVARKFARAHRPLVVGTTAVLAALLLGLAGTTYGLVKAVGRSRVAEERRVSAERLATLLQQMLREAHPHEAKGKAYTVRQMLDDFSRRFADGMEDQPLVEAALRSTMGTGYRVLGEYALARPQLERALALRRAADPPSPAALGDALCDMAWLEHDAAEYAKAIAFFKEAAGAAGNDPWVAARAVHGWSDCLRHAGDFAEARTQGREAVRVAALIEAHQPPATHPSIAEQTGKADTLIAEAHLNLSRIERDAGDYAAAQTELDEAMKLLQTTIGPDDPRLADALNDEAWLAMLRRDYPRAETTVRSAVDVATRTLGPGHPDLGNSKYELGLILSSRGDNKGAETLLHESIAIFVAAHGDRHPSTFTAQEALARVLRSQGRYAEARDLIERVLAGRREFFGERNIEVGYALSALGQIQRDLKETDAAEASTLAGLEIYRATYKGPHGFIGNGELLLARLATDRGDLARAEALFRQAIGTYEAALGPGHADTLTAVIALASCLEARADWAHALAEYDRVLERRSPSKSAVRVALMKQGRGRCLLSLARNTEAVDALRAALSELEAAAVKSKSAEQYIAPAREDLAKALETAGDREGAAATRSAKPAAATPPRE